MTGEISDSTTGTSLLNRKWVKVFLLVFFAFSTFFVHNSILHPDIMEVRNLVTAHEMLTDGNWIVTTMNGEYRFEKPPLPTWVAAGVEGVFGDSLAMQRAAAGMMGLLLAYFLYVFVRRITEQKSTGIVAALMLLTCYNVVLQGRTATWDIYCHAFMLGGVYFLYKALYSPMRVSNFLFAGVLMGLSFMSKGPVAITAMLLPAVIALLVWRLPDMRGRWLALVGMIVIAVVLGVWWYAYIYLSVSDAATEIVQKETTSWVGHNVRPWWYYWRFFLESGIWAPLLVYVIVRAIMGWKSENAATRIGLVWTLAGVLILSLFPEKKMRYLMPLMVPCCLLMASWVASHWQARTVRRLVGVVCCLFVLFECFGFPSLKHILGYDERESLSELRTLVAQDSSYKVCYVNQEGHIFRIDMVYHLMHKIETCPSEELDSYLSQSENPVLLLLPHDFDLADISLPEGAALSDEGTYDDNSHPLTDKHYNTSLVNRAVMFTPSVAKP